MTSRSMRAVTIAAIASLALVACGSDDNADTTTPAATAPGATEPEATVPAATDLVGTSPSSEPAATDPADDPVAAAQALVDEYSAAQDAVALDALPAKPEAGKTIAVLTCAFPACQSTTDGVNEAAALLGWDVVTYTSEITPEAYAGTWDRLLQDPPDLIAFTGLLPNELIADQLAKVEELGIPTVAIAASDSPGGVMQAVYVGAAQLIKSGQLMGAAVAADGGAGVKTVFVWDPNTKAIMGPVKDNFTEQIEAVGGSVEVLEISLQETGKAVPGQVVSFLQANPDVKYVAFSIADFSAGVPQALAAAGIDGVKIIGRSPQASNLDNILNGSEWAAVAEESVAGGYRAVDGLARIMAGVSFDAEPEGWHQILTADNISDVNTALETPGVPDAFAAAWLLNG